MTRRAAGPDDGFTLIEVILAMLIMTIAVVTVVGALASMMGLSREHRAHASVEPNVRSFGQAVIAKATSGTVLTDAAGASGPIVVAEPMLLPDSGGLITVGRETMRVTGKSGTTVSVDRGHGGTVAAAHAAGSRAVTLLYCPTEGELTPAAGAWIATNGATTSTVTAVEYWRADLGRFDSVRGQAGPPSGCLGAWALRCGSDLRPECGSGLVRVTVSSSAAGAPGTSSVSTHTTLLVRRGSA